MMALSTSENTHAGAEELGVPVVPIHLRGVCPILLRGHGFPAAGRWR
jgi:hypothetical protein